MHWSVWGVSHLGQAKLVYYNQILSQVADQNYIAIPESNRNEIQWYLFDDLKSEPTIF